MKKRSLLTIVSFVFALAISSCGSAPSETSKNQTDDIIYHFVTFDSNGGSPVESQRVKHGEKITKPEDPTRQFCSFNNWTYNDEEWSFIGYVVTEDITLFANWNYPRPGETITYGLYPQKNVDDSELLEALDELSTPESNGWYLYEDDYYAKVSANPYNSNYQFDNGTTIASGTTYWFKCEPITWKIISENNGEYYLLSTVLLDAHCYYQKTYTIIDGQYWNITYDRIIDGQTIYVSNYKHSDIRTWLNEEFYNSAFALENSCIQVTTVDNSPATTDSTSNSYSCEDTLDKVFLPSYRDYINSSYGFSSSTSSTNTRCCKTTDWARARGAYYYTSAGNYQYNGYYWTRSPQSVNRDYAWHIDYDGARSGYYDVNYANGSVRPAITIRID